MTDPEDPDLLAAEYVLGTADEDERAAVASRLASGDAVLAEAVRAWEERLACLAAATPEVEPPPEVYDALTSRLFAGAPAPAGGARSPSPTSVLRARLRRWQAATAAFAALAAALLATLALREFAAEPHRERLIAVLQTDAASPAMVVDVDLAARRLTVRPLDTTAPAGHVYELWIIDPTLGAPRSLGLIPARADGRDSISEYDPAVIAGATYAVTVEPPGGSPTGRPSAPPVLTGKLVRSST